MNEISDRSFAAVNVDLCCTMRIKSYKFEDRNSASNFGLAKLPAGWGGFFAGINGRHMF